MTSDTFSHCTTCSCVPGMTPAIRYDTTPAEKEGAVRDHLIRMGWTPPSAPVRHFTEEVGKDGNPTGYLLFGQSAPVGVEASYHPCTRILIEGLKRLDGGADVLGDWDRARAKTDAALAQQPAAVDDLNAWRAAFIAERATRYRERGMSIEQARIHAETDAALMENGDG